MGTDAVHDSAVQMEGGWFRTTQWTDVLQAKDSPETGVARAGLSKICENYWRPIYGYLRWSGYSRADAEDLTQGLFEHLFSHDWLKNVKPGNGKFRSFLLTALKNFCINTHVKARAVKRGGNEVFIPLHEINCEEERVLRESGALTPEQNFDRRWAESLMERAINCLREEYIASGKADLYNELKGITPGEHGVCTYAEIGARLDLSEGAVKSAVHRMRARLSSILRMEIQATVSTKGEVNEELRYLREALSR